MRHLILTLCALVILLGACQEMTSEEPEVMPTSAALVAPPVASSDGSPAAESALSTVAPTTTATPVSTDTPPAESSAGGTVAVTTSPAAVTATSTTTATLNASTTAASPTRVITTGVEGALIRVRMEGQVGVLLDEFPQAMRQRVADAIMAEPAEEWEARARRQVRLTRHRLNFRNYNRPGKGQLPLTQPELWSIQLDDGGPVRQIVQGHDLIVAGYTFTTTILTDAGSAAASEPALDEPGGRWEEPFMLPLDPDLLLQRTGFACINDNGFPPDSVDSENAWYYYDFTRASCREAVAIRVGTVDSALVFERLSWDEDLASAVRTGPVTNVETADIRVVGEDLEHNRIVYRYISPGDCAFVEGAVSGSGWRRLLQFDSTVHNVGNEPLHIGPVVGNSGIDDMFVAAPCHDHVHYNYYGEFLLRNQDEVTSSKQAFCVQSTNRLSNNELSPLTHDYSCDFQGVQTGWVDEYFAGLNTQWMDITGLEVGPEGETVELGFHFNPEQFLCEGTPLVEENGERLWQLSGFTTEDGVPIKRPQCEFIPGWDENNEAVQEVFIPPTGSFVTAPCANGESGPLRNCGFSEVTVAGVDAVCPAGPAVELTLRTPEESPPQVVRVCEWSAALGTGVACTFEDSLANTIVSEQPTSVIFTCPLVRDAEESADEETTPSYALYAAPVWPGDEAQPILAVE